MTVTGWGGRSNLFKYPRNRFRYCTVIIIITLIETNIAPNRKPLQISKRKTIYNIPVPSFKEGKSWENMSRHCPPQKKGDIWLPFHHVRIGKVANMGGVPTISWANDYPDPETDKHSIWNWPSQKQTIVFQHFIFRCYSAMLVSGRVFLNVLWSLQLNQESIISRSNPSMEILHILQSLPKRKADSI